jgi:hypothetical protein
MGVDMHDPLLAGLLLIVGGVICWQLATLGHSLESKLDVMTANIRDTNKLLEQIRNALNESADA